MNKKVSKKDVVVTDCTVFDKCTDYPKKCNSCKSNMFIKRSFYRPLKTEKGF